MRIGSLVGLVAVLAVIVLGVVLPIRDRGPDTAVDAPSFDIVSMGGDGVEGTEDDIDKYTKN